LNACKKHGMRFPTPCVNNWLIVCLLDVNQFLLMMDIPPNINFGEFDNFFSCPIILNKTYSSKNNYMPIDVKFFEVSGYCIILFTILLLASFKRIKKIYVFGHRRYFFADTVFLLRYGKIQL
jgi:hypothetical protein